MRMQTMRQSHELSAKYRAPGRSRLKTLIAAICDEVCRRFQYRGIVAKRGNRGLGVGDQFLEPFARAVDPEQAHEGGLVRGRILAGRLADGRCIAVDIEQIVRYLECFADRGTCLLYTSDAA